MLEKMTECAGVIRFIFGFYVNKSDNGVCSLSGECRGSLRERLAVRLPGKGSGEEGEYAHCVDLQRRG
jgi:hypothetical protein